MKIRRTCLALFTLSAIVFGDDGSVKKFETSLGTFTIAVTFPSTGGQLCWRQEHITFPDGKVIQGYPLTMPIIRDVVELSRKVFFITDDGSGRSEGTIVFQYVPEKGLESIFTCQGAPRIVGEGTKRRHHIFALYGERQMMGFLTFHDGQWQAHYVRKTIDILNQRIDVSPLVREKREVFVIRRIKTTDLFEFDPDSGEFEELEKLEEKTDH